MGDIIVSDDVSSLFIFQKPSSTEIVQTLMDASLFRKLIVEFIGTFFLVYVVGCVSLQEHVLLGPLAIGASLMVMIFAGGHITGRRVSPRPWFFACSIDCHSSSGDAGGRSGNFRFGLHSVERGYCPCHF